MRRSFARVRYEEDEEENEDEEDVWMIMLDDDGKAA